MQINSINAATNFKGESHHCEFCEPTYRELPALEEGYDEFESSRDIIDCDDECGCEKYDKAVSLAEEFDDKFVKANDIKGPGAVLLSVGVAGVKTFLKTVATVFAVDKVTKHKTSGLFETGLKKGSNLVKGTADKLVQSEGKKLSKLANKVGELTQKANGGLKGAYNKICETMENGTKQHSASKGLAVLAGITAVLTIVPAICKRDNNEDGIPDLVQKSQSAYEKVDDKCSKVLDGASTINQIAQLVS